MVEAEDVGLDRRHEGRNVAAVGGLVREGPIVWQQIDEAQRAGRARGHAGGPLCERWELVGGGLVVHLVAEHVADRGDARAGWPGPGGRLAGRRDAGEASLGARGDLRADGRGVGRAEAAEQRRKARGPHTGVLRGEVRGRDDRVDPAADDEAVKDEGAGGIGGGRCGRRERRREETTSEVPHPNRVVYGLARVETGCRLRRVDAKLA